MRIYIGLLVSFALLLSLSSDVEAKMSKKNLQAIKTFATANRNSFFKLLKNDNLPNPSINKPLNQTEIDDLDSNVFISQFFNFILTGRYDGITEIGDQFDNNSLHVILGLGIQVYITVIQDDPPDDAIG